MTLRSQCFVVIEVGRAVEDMAREVGVSRHTSYAERQSTGGMRIRRRVLHQHYWHNPFYMKIRVLARRVSLHTLYPWILEIIAFEKDKFVR